MDVYDENACESQLLSSNNDNHSMVQPLHSSFTLLPAIRGKNSSPELIFKTSQATPLLEATRRSKKRSLVDAAKSRDFFGNHPFELVRRRVLSASETRARSYPQHIDWRYEYFKLQERERESAKRMREMEEDQRQLRRRIWELEERLSRNPPQPAWRSSSRSRAPPVSPESGSSQSDRPPAFVVTVPLEPRHASCFYLTDSEGLSDSEQDYQDETQTCFDEEEDENRSEISATRS